jgi:hypothetical protein
LICCRLFVDRGTVVRADFVRCCCGRVLLVSPCCWAFGRRLGVVFDVVVRCCCRWLTCWTWRSIWYSDYSLMLSGVGYSRDLLLLLSFVDIPFVILIHSFDTLLLFIGIMRRDIIVVMLFPDCWVLLLPVSDGIVVAAVIFRCLLIYSVVDCGIVLMMLFVLPDTFVHSCYYPVTTMPFGGNLLEIWYRHSTICCSFGTFWSHLFPDTFDDTDILRLLLFLLIDSVFLFCCSHYILVVVHFDCIVTILVVYIHLVLDCYIPVFDALPCWAAIPVVGTCLCYDTVVFTIRYLILPFVWHWFTVLLILLLLMTIRYSMRYILWLLMIHCCSCDMMPIIRIRYLLPVLLILWYRWCSLLLLLLCIVVILLMMMMVCTYSMCVIVLLPVFICCILTSMCYYYYCYWYCVVVMICWLLLLLIVDIDKWLYCVQCVNRWWWYYSGWCDVDVVIGIDDVIVIIDIVCVLVMMLFDCYIVVIILLMIFSIVDGICCVTIVDVDCYYYCYWPLNSCCMYCCLLIVRIDIYCIIITFIPLFIICIVVTVYYRCIRWLFTWYVIRCIIRYCSVLLFRYDCYSIVDWLLFCDVLYLILYGVLYCIVVLVID